jgi:hypothetical protein
MQNNVASLVVCNHPMVVILLSKCSGRGREQTPSHHVIIVGASNFLFSEACSPGFFLKGRFHFSTYTLTFKIWPITVKGVDNLHILSSILADRLNAGRNARRKARDAPTPC